MVDLAKGKPGGNGPVGVLGGVQVCFRGAQAGGEPVVVGVGDDCGLTRWWGLGFEQGRVGRGQCPVVAGPCGQDLLVGFLLRRVGDQPGRIVVGGGVRVVESRSKCIRAVRAGEKAS